MQYSGAYNNVSFLNGGVDPQTGLYTLSFPLGNLLSSDGFGPSFSLSMNYSPLSTGTVGNKGLGNGWSFNLPNVNRKASKITLLNGQTFTLRSMGANREWTLKNHKVKDVRILQNLSLIHI